jgi:hypothetical protein
MTYGALAMFAGAILFGARDEADGASRDGKHLGQGPRRTDRGLRKPVPGDPAMIEDDYFRFLNRPRD